MDAVKCRLPTRQEPKPINLSGGFLRIAMVVAAFAFSLGILLSPTRMISYANKEELNASWKSLEQGLTDLEVITFRLSRPLEALILRKLYLKYEVFGRG